MMIMKVLALVVLVLGVAGSCARTEPGDNGGRGAVKDTGGAGEARRAAGLVSKPVFTCTSAGRWFAADPKELRDTVDSYLDKVDGVRIGGRITALIAPHAGYQFSGPVAAHAYKLLKGLRFDTVVVVGFSHSVYLPEISVYEKGSFRTPLGDIPIDEDAAAALIAEDPRIKYNHVLFEGEHSVDNQLPFLQRTLSGFKLVPIMFGSQTEENIGILAAALAKVLKGRNALLIASTDMSHFWRQEEAKKLDAEVLERVRAMDAGGIGQLMKDDPSGRRLCGYGAVQAVIRAAKELGAAETRVLRYATSQDTYGATGNGVVGYVAAVLIDKNGKNEAASAEDDIKRYDKEKKMGKPEFGGELDEAARKELLGIARKSLETYVMTGKPYKADSDSPQLQMKRGVFVTLNINEALRGCMGYFEADTPLKDIVARQAVVSATQDPRFPPVRPGELSKIDVEISVLSEPEYVDSYKDIEVGKHGVIIEKGYYRATFLPQVAPEQGWDRDTMLTNLSLKAGLPPNSWKEGCRFQVYTAQVFGEKD